MNRLLGSKSLPPGFRFHPTDEELCVYYLKRKVMAKPLGVHMMSELDVYKFAPWDLPSKACMKTRDLIWYFFCPRGRKYVHGGKTNRATEFGYWKSTGTDRNVQYSHRTVGKIKTLVFYRGKAPKGERTDWVMHEYRLEDQVLVDMGVSQDAFVICKVYEKSGPGPRNGEHHGAQFVEEEWDSDDDDNVEAGCGIIVHSGHDHIADRQNVHVSSTITASENVSGMTMGNYDGTATASTAFTGSASLTIPDVTSSVGTPTGIIPVDAVNAAAVASSIAEQQAPFAVGVNISDGDDELDRLLAMFTDDDISGTDKILDGDIFSGLEDLANGYIELDDLK